MKRILCDADGVFVDFIGGLCTELGKRGFVRKPADIKSWSLEESLTPKEARECMHIMSAPGFCHGLAFYEGGPEFLGALKEEGELFVVTAPFDGSETWERERKARLEPLIARKRVLPISGEFKHLVRGDILIEDHPGTAFEWLQSNTNGHAVLIDRPWNGPGAKEWHMHRRMYRAKSYVEALSIVKEFCT